MFGSSWGKRQIARRKRANHNVVRLARRCFAACIQTLAITHPFPSTLLIRRWSRLSLFIIRMSACVKERIFHVERGMHAKPTGLKIWLWSRGG